MKKLKIGFVTNNEKIDFYKKNLIDYVNNNSNFDKSILINLNSKKSIYLKKSFFQIFKISLYEKIINKILKKIINFVEIQRTKKIKFFSNYGDEVGINTLNLEIFNIELNKNLHDKEEINKSDLNSLVNQNIDILIFFEKKVKGIDLINVSKLGALILKKK